MRGRWMILAVAMAAAVAGGVLAGSGPVTAATTLPSTPQVGMQDGWLERPSGQGCASNEENTLARPVPGPNYMTSIPTAVDDGANWTDLNVHYLRITVPWDIAYHHDRAVTVQQHGQRYTLDPNQILSVEQQCLDFWLADIHRADAHQQALHRPLLQPEVQFRPDYNYLGTGRNAHHIMIPSLATYRAAMSAFTATYNCGPSNSAGATCPLPASLPTPSGGGPMTRVSTLAPWGEPDFDVHGSTRPNGAIDGWFFMPQGSARFGQANCSSGVNSCGPVLAAQMWVTVHRDCRTCTVIAGTFGSSRGKDHAYLTPYAHNLNGLRPAVWAIDNYTDIEAYENACQHNQCGAPAPSSTLVWAYSSWLHALHYGSHTRIWFGEISVFDINSLSKNHTHYGFAVEHKAADYLLKHLAKPGASTPSGSPWVQRLYYMRYADGASYPDFALVLANPSAHTETRVPAYAAFRYRSAPQH